MILIISDYHKHERRVLELIEKYNPEYTLCCGDGESKDSFYQENNIISVKGNCDLANLELVKLIDIDEYKIVMVHGHNHNVYFDTYKLYLLAKEHGRNMVLYGHTHIAEIDEYDGVTIINPGALKEGNYAIINEGKIELKEL